MMLNGWLKNTTDMETKFNFKSQICTSVEQSRMLLELGLNKETADMHWFYTGKIHGWQCCVQCYQDAIAEPFRKEDATNGNILPAWSLGRLIEVLKRGCGIGDWNYMELSYNHPMEDLLGRIETIIISNNFNNEYLV